MPRLSSRAAAASERTMRFMRSTSMRARIDPPARPRRHGRVVIGERIARPVGRRDDGARRRPERSEPETKVRVDRGYEAGAKARVEGIEGARGKARRESR